MKNLLSLILVLFTINLSAQVQVAAPSPQASFNVEIFKQFKDSIRNQAIARGNEGGHGGDSYVLEFITLGKLIAAGLKSFSAENLAQSNLTQAAFEQVVNEVKVTSHTKDLMLLNGQEVDAINFPDKLSIKLNRDRWREVTLEQKLRLVLHEYFGILGIERDSYQVSLRFSSFIQMLANEISSNPDYKHLSVNLFYGQCNVYPSLSTSEICDLTSPRIAEAIECSKRKAYAKCTIADRADCKIIETTTLPILSTQYVGMRYCEILTIAK